MCTIGGLGRQSTDYRSTIGRQSTDYRSTVDRLSVDSRPIERPTVDRYIGRQWTDKCAHIGWCIGRQSVDISVEYRSTIGRQSVDWYIGWQSTDKCVHIRWCIGRLTVYISVDYRSTIGRLSVDFRSTIGRLSAYMSTEATYSTHDPSFLDFSHHHDVLHLVAVWKSSNEI